MQASVVLPLSLLAIAGVVLLLGVAIAVRRMSRDISEGRLEIRQARLRPMMLRILSDDDPDLSKLNMYQGADIVLLETIAWQLLSKVRGAARQSLVDWLLSRGAVERARLGTHRRSAVVRARCAQQLGAVGVTEVLVDLVRLLNDRHGDVRVVAARALGKLGDESAVAPLLETLDHHKAIPFSLVTMALLHIGTPAIDPLIKGLGSRSVNVRCVCVDLLGMHGALPASRWLIVLADCDPAESVRVRAIGALGRIGVPSAVPVLLTSLRADRPRSIRIAAAKALGQIGGRDAIESLQLTLYDGDDGLGSAAAEALAMIGIQAEHILIDAAQSDTTATLRARDWLARARLGSESRRRQSTPKPLSAAASREV